MPLVPTWMPAGKLMRFPWLTASEFEVDVYTVAWRITDRPDDEWSDRFNKFKDGNDIHVKGALRVLEAAIRELGTIYNFNPAATGIAVALSHKVERLDLQSPLGIVGKTLAARLGMNWVGAAFTKPTHRSLHTIYNGSERDAEVAGKYRCIPLDGIETVIILDDLVTRGATFGEMKRACCSTNPKIKIIGLALGKTEKAGFAKQYGVDINNRHVPGEWDNLWNEGGG